MALNAVNQHKGAIVRPARNNSNAYASVDPLGTATGGGGGSAPSAVSDLTLDSIGSSSAGLSWTLPANTDNVEVYRRDVTAAGSFTLIATLGAVSSYNNTGLASENQYEWKVVATNEFGGGVGVNDSNVVSGTTTAASGTSALEYSAPNGLADGETITISTDGTYTFTPPDKFVWLGFGQGWLYENPLDTELTDVTVGGELLVYHKQDDLTPRTIKEVNGIRFLECTVLPDGEAQDASRATGGNIDWDTGSEVTNSDTIFVSSLSSCSHGTVADAYFQWKQPRINQDGWADFSGGGENRNMLYYTNTDGWARFLGRPGSGDDSSANFTGASQGDGERYMGFVWRPNTAGSNDGYLAAHKINTGSGGYLVDLNPTDSGGDDLKGFISSASTARPRTAQFQDYIGNNNDGTRNVVIRRTDIYMKRGGVLFMLGDADTPANCTHLVPLVPESTSDSQWVCKLWKQRMNSYTGKHILYFDEELNFIDSVALS